MSKYRSWILALCGALVVSGCSTLAEKKAKEGFENRREDAEGLLRHLDEIHSPLALESEGLFLGGKKVRLPEEPREEPEPPEQFQQEISIGSIAGMPLASYLEDITRLTGIRVSVAPDAEEYLSAISSGGEGGGSGGGAADSTNVVGGDGGGSSSGAQSYFLSVVHQGSVKSLLDKISSHANVYWRWDPWDRRAVIYRHINEDFHVRGFAGVSTVQANFVGGRSSSSGNGDNVQTSQQVGVGGADLDLWQSILADIETKLSGSGELSVSGTTGTISVSDTPPVVAKIRQYVESINEMLSTQVMVKARVYEITSSMSDEYGIDWSFLYERNSGSGSVGFDTGLLDGFNAPEGGFNILRSGDSYTATLEAFIKALSRTNNVSFVRSVETATLNGQPVSVQVTRNRDYLARVSITETEAGNEQVELEPGTLTSGLQATIWPKVENHDEVMLQVALNLATTEELEEFTSAGVTLQLPTESVRNILQRVKLSSGDTLILTGFEQDEDRVGHEGVSRATGPFGGRNEASTTRTSIVILLTPFVMGT